MRGTGENHRTALLSELVEGKKKRYHLAGTYSWIGRSDRGAEKTYCLPWWREIEGLIFVCLVMVEHCLRTSGQNRKKEGV